MRLLWLCVFVMPLTALCQNQLFLTVQGGVTNYQGDLQYRNFTLEQSNGAFGLGVKYDLTEHFAMRAGFLFGRISGSDALNKPSLQSRNLSFQNNITEGSLTAEFDIFSLYRHRFSPYIFAGLAAFHHNPYAFDSTGNKVYLHELSTEGQGLPQYPDRKKYALNQVALPFGGGIKFRISDNAVLGYEIGLRKLFTDYLDDVSTSYVDQGVLLQEKGPKAVEMAYRGGELKDGNATYPNAGSPRGGAKYKDWYYFQGITLEIAIGGNASNSSRALRCPPSPNAGY